MKASEAKIQHNVFVYMWNNYPFTRGLINSIPNETGRIQGESSQNQFRRINKLKGMGMIKGHPDLELNPPFKMNCFIEFKAENGVLSKEQILQHERLRKSGREVFVCKSENEAIEIIKKVFNIKD